ncbi:MAG: TPM domain-containing protein [Bacteroidales bacterium]|jgi:uncharacterized protein|nr:TPM domain-containing protein [Bacteroidales bacterium]
MKKILVFLLFLPILAFSQEKQVFDNAGILSADEIAALQARIAAVKSAYDFNIVIVTETNIGDAEPMDYADDFFDYNGFQNETGGALLLQVTETRDWHISTFGKGKLGGETIFNTYALEKTGENIVGYLKKDNPAGAYNAFMDDVEKYLQLATDGKHLSSFSNSITLFIIGGWVLAFLIALGIVTVWKHQLNTARGDKQARAYIVAGSLQFNESADRFLYSTISMTAKPKESSSSSGGGSHTSSSGSSHGGSGGKY